MTAPLCRAGFALAVACALVAAHAAAAQEPTVQPPSAARVAVPEELRKQLGLSPRYDGQKGLERVKIAVLDYGFEGVDGVRPYLPADTVVVEHYDPELARRFKLGDPDFKKGFE